MTLLGPSGSGKSTMLNIVTAFALPDGGDVTVDDVNVTNLPPNRRHIGMVFQNYAIVPIRERPSEYRLSVEAAGREEARDVDSRIGDRVPIWWDPQGSVFISNRAASRDKSARQEEKLTRSVKLETEEMSGDPSGLVTESRAKPGR